MCLERNYTASSRSDRRASPSVCVNLPISSHGSPRQLNQKPLDQKAAITFSISFLVSTHACDVRTILEKGTFLFKGHLNICVNLRGCVAHEPWLMIIDDFRFPADEQTFSDFESLEPLEPLEPFVLCALHMVRRALYRSFIDHSRYLKHGGLQRY